MSIEYMSEEYVEKEKEIILDLLSNYNQRMKARKYDTLDSRSDTIFTGNVISKRVKALFDYGYDEAVFSMIEQNWEIIQYVPYNKTIDKNFIKRACEVNPKCAKYCFRVVAQKEDLQLLVALYYADPTIIRDIAGASGIEFGRVYDNVCGKFMNLYFNKQLDEHQKLSMFYSLDGQTCDSLEGAISRNEEIQNNDEQVNMLQNSQVFYSLDGKTYGSIGDAMNRNEEIQNELTTNKINSK